MTAFCVCIACHVVVIMLSPQGEERGAASWWVRGSSSEWQESSTESAPLAVSDAVARRMAELGLHPAPAPKRTPVPAPQRAELGLE